MKMLKTTTCWCVLNVALLFLFSPSETLAAKPFNVFGLGNKVEADPNKEYVLNETDGPWMILVATFSGSSARQDANTLVLELRKRYKYNAFVFDRTFVHDMRMESRRNPFDRGNFQKKGTVHEYAVLVGSFQSVDDKAFQKTLKGIKECYPDCVKGGTNAVVTSVNFAELRRRVTRDENGRMRGPFYMAFGTPNPLLPPDYLSNRGTVDDFVVRLNSERPFSLLECPATYTVRIATFTGKTEIQQDRIKDILDGRKEFLAKKPWESELEIGGKAAGRLAATLRTQGYEAYEFHDRQSSIVTIGGFNEIGRELPNGQIELRPEIVDIMNRFQARPADPSRIQQGGVRSISYEPVVIQGIECDTQPQIIKVPRPWR